MRVNLPFPRMETAQAEAEATVSRLKEQGIDTDNLTPQEMVQASIDARNRGDVPTVRVET